MTGEPQITVVGNLTSDPELRFTSQSLAVASFTVASTPRSYNRNSGQWEEGTTLFIRCSAWREMAENINESLRKGMRVIVTGRLVQRNWERDGQNRSSMEIQVDEIGPSLRYAQAQVNRIARSDSNYGSNQGGNYSNAGGGNFNGYNQGGNNYEGSNQGSGFGGPANGSNDDPWATGSSGDFGGSSYDQNPPF